jgi:hypothetical protein
MAKAGKMEPRAEDGWHEARSIPTPGIGGQEEQEKRATSSLLAVMLAVPEFGKRSWRMSTHLRLASRPMPTCSRGTGTRSCRSRTEPS